MVQTKESKRAWRIKNLDKARSYVQKWRTEHPQQRSEQQQQHNKTYYQKHIQQEKQRQFVRYHTQIKKKKKLSEAQLRCIAESREYDKLRDVSSYSHKEGG